MTAPVPIPPPTPGRRPRLGASSVTRVVAAFDAADTADADRGALTWCAHAAGDRACIRVPRLAGPAEWHVGYTMNLIPLLALLVILLVGTWLKWRATRR